MKFTFIFTMIYELWENRYIGIFKQFSFIMVTGISALVATDTIFLVF